MHFFSAWTNLLVKLCAQMSALFMLEVPLLIRHDNGHRVHPQLDITRVAIG